NRVDEIRDLRQNVQYRPARARFKIYIIAEVHMVTTAAFNALLKTLEEPPPHVKFIFATTEVQKIPSTILSRCQRFDSAWSGTVGAVDRRRAATRRVSGSIDRLLARLDGRELRGRRLWRHQRSPSPSRLDDSTSQHDFLGLHFGRAGYPGSYQGALARQQSWP